MGALLFSRMCPVRMPRGHLESAQPTPALLCNSTLPFARTSALLVPIPATGPLVQRALCASFRPLLPGHGRRDYHPPTPMLALTLKPSHRAHGSPLHGFGQDLLQREAADDAGHRQALADRRVERVELDVPGRKNSKVNCQGHSQLVANGADSTRKPCAPICG